MQGIRVTERTYTQKGKINPKVRKPESSFLYPTCHLALFYISAKYHQNIPKGIRVTERAQNQIHTRRGSKKARVIILVPETSLILFYISTKYHQNIPKGIRVTERTRNQFQTTNQREITPKVRKPELSFLYASHHLILFYISTMYH